MPPYLDESCHFVFCPSTKLKPNIILSTLLFADSKYNKVNFRVLQLVRMRKYIIEDVALAFYKQMILPFFDYADFMVESTSKM